MKFSLLMAVDKIEGAIKNLDNVQHQVFVRLKDISKGAPGNEAHYDKCKADLGDYINKLESVKSCLEGLILIDELEGDE